MVQHKASSKFGADDECADPVKYVVILPARDEEKFIRLTLESMARQTVLPREMIVVDDGSSDGTAGIVREFAQTYPWVRLVQRADRGIRALGAGVIDAFKFGQENLRVSNFEFIVKLDGDLSFETDYFERLLRKFAENPKLGIASGQTHICRNGELVVERINKAHARGASKVYRRSCFEQIGGLVPIIGWDMVDELYAQFHGWQTRSYPELVLIHHRPMGTSQGSALRGKMRWGMGRYVTGSHPLFILVSGVYRMFERPYVLGGLALMYGYCAAFLGRHPRIREAEVRRFQRRKELQRLSPIALLRTLFPPRENRPVGGRTDRD